MSRFKLHAFENMLHFLIKLIYLLLSLVNSIDEIFISKHWLHCFDIFIFFIHVLVNYFQCFFNALAVPKVQSLVLDLSLLFNIFIKFVAKDELILFNKFFFLHQVHQSVHIFLLIIDRVHSSFLNLHIHSFKKHIQIKVRFEFSTPL